MTTGLTRRESTQDRLAGRADVEPVLIQGPGIQSPVELRQPEVSFSSRIADQLAQWSGGKLQAAVNKQQEKDALDGQMAYAQGEAIDSAEMKGNKFALDGYRVMQAQTLSSTMLAAQQEKISQADYALDPDQFRAQYVQRLDAMLDGVDPDTARLVREQMTKQMPTLVAQHTQAHLTYMESQNFESLEASIDIVSRDPTATDQLVAFARGGDDSASGGLSEDRRQAAVVSGVVRAFDNDNPLAFSALMREGLLGDNLTSDEQNQIRGAQQRFESRRHSEYNETLFAGEQDLMRKVENGDLSPTAAVEELSLLYADHDIEMNRADAGTIYAQAEAGQGNARLTRGLVIDEALARGDYEAGATAIIDSLTVTESGGNSAAFRTNRDGRQFGGLLQFGQDRLNETLDMMGRGRLTVAQFTALPAAEQNAINKAHVVDLMKAAEDTGAIGTTINGVTVTMAGLVAVGHLGGKIGMYRFVETNGEYNPQDEEGTSLTDYLSKHGAGVMDEFMSPAQRYEIAQQRLTKTREQLALDTYEQIAPKLADADDRYKRGEITKADWQAERNGLYQTYESSKTKADIDGEIAFSRSVDDHLAREAKTAQDIDRKYALESANAAITAPRLEWERVINNPASTNAELAAANQTYIEARSAIYDQYGIPVPDRGNGDTASTMITKTAEAMERQRVFQEQQVEIDMATANGYLSKLPKDLQSRAFKQNEDEVLKTYNDAVAAGQMSQAQANAAIAEDMNAFYASAGVVDPKVAMKFTAAMLGPMIDKDGNPNPQIVDTVAQFAQIKALNKRAADSMFDPEALIKAEAVLSRASDPSLIGDAVRNVGLELSNSPLIKDTDEFLALPATQRAIDREVENYFETRDIGILQAIWQKDAFQDQRFDRGRNATDMLWSEDNQQLVKSEVSQETARLQRINPNIKPRDLVAKATENVARRTEIIGGDVIMLKPGKDISYEFFGDRAMEFTHDGAVNSAVMEYLRSPEVVAAYPFINEVTVSESMPGWMQGLVDAIPGVEFDPAMSARDAISTARTDVRPFRAFPTPGGQIAVQIIRPDGNYSDPIIIPAREAGEMYMKRRRQDMTR